MRLRHVRSNMEKQPLPGKPYHLINDPLFYSIAAFFALLTTAMPAALGQPRFLVLIQTLALFAFLFYTIRHGYMRQALQLLALWVTVQVITLLIVSVLLPDQVQRAINSGFEKQSEFIGWFHGNQPLADTLWQRPGQRLGEWLGIFLGSLLTGGLVGVGFLVSAVNVAVFKAGALLQGGWLLLPAALPPWSLLRLTSYAGFIALLAEPLLTSNWSLRYYLTVRRRHLQIATTLLVAGLILEAILPGAWRALFQL